MVDLGLGDPAAQGRLMDGQVLRDVRDRPAGGADLAGRSPTQFIGVFDLLRRLSQETNVNLRDVCTRLLTDIAGRPRPRDPLCGPALDDPILAIFSLCPVRHPIVVTV
ncbi:ANTAR domain-containing protein [Streptomyces sp. NPDC102467]|uniref:ANTAR domain-containing protein n=1 Tax=Streptomyces sp. NPDC102467 TaxID=3366179 RepID=UPI003821A04A